MKIVVASDSFKGCLSSSEVADAVESGIRCINSDIDVIKLGVADGGEGTSDVIGRACKGKCVSGITYSALGEELMTTYWIINNDTAVIDVASSCGLAFCGERPDVMNSSSYGFGLVLLDAYDNGCRKFIIGLGGSATCDAGLGLLAALGVRFLPILNLNNLLNGMPTASAMNVIKSFNLSRARKDIMDCEFTILTDVSNPLYGPDGAAAVFSPQKGATPEQVSILDAGLRQMARIGMETTGNDMSFSSGAGAAGGLGWAFMTFFNSRISSGVQEVLNIIGFDNAVMNADLVITGEGRIDRQTLSGKLPLGVCQRAKKFCVPVVALAGSVSDTEALLDAGFDGVFPITPGPMSLQEAMSNETARKSIRDVVASVVSLYASSRDKL